jgi:signal transduction histidine kinase
MNTLSAKIALLLGAVFLVMTALLVALAHAEHPRERALSVEATVGLLGLTLLGAWGALWPLTRRIRRVGVAVESLARGGSARPLRLPDADAHGDEIGRLAAQAEQVAQQIADQSAALALAARRRSELLANVSHDLRTPLASMQGYLELLLLRHGSLDPAEAQNYLQTAARQSERLGRLVGDLFELTRLEAGDAQVQAEPFVLAELAQDVVQKYRADASARGVALGVCGEAERGESGDVGEHESAGKGDGCAGVQADAGSTTVQADIALIERVLASLVDNALRHTPGGGAVNITIGGDAQRARVAVRDTGAGIAAEDLPGIFERYERAGRVGDTGSSHAGLGLAIARRIVQLHGSTLQVHSVAGQGTCVSFDLARPVPRSGAHGSSGAAPRGQGLPA